MESGENGKVLILLTPIPSSLLPWIFVLNTPTAALPPTPSLVKMWLNVKRETMLPSGCSWDIGAGWPGAIRRGLNVVYSSASDVKLFRVCFRYRIVLADKTSLQWFLWSLLYLQKALISDCTIRLKPTAT